MKTTVKIALLGAVPGVLVVVLAGTLSAAGAGGPGTPAVPSAPHGTLLLTKTCVGDHCTVVTSSSGPFPVGSDIAYFGPLLEARTTSRIVVTTPDGDTAAGHCSLSYRKWTGVCVITDGTGDLAGLHANVQVTSDFSSDPNGVFTWDGDYHFGG